MSYIEILQRQYKLAINNHGLLTMGNVPTGKQGMKIAVVVDSREVIVVVGRHGACAIDVATGSVTSEGKGDWALETTPGLMLDNVVSGLGCCTLTSLFDDSIDFHIDADRKLVLFDQVTQGISSAIGDLVPV